MPTLIKQGTSESRLKFYLDMYEEDCNDPEYAESGGDVTNREVLDRLRAIDCTAQRFPTHEEEKEFAESFYRCPDGIALQGGAPWDWYTCEPNVDPKFHAIFTWATEIMRSDVDTWQRLQTLAGVRK